MLDTETLLQQLHERRVRFVIIGGIAAVAHGVAHVTADLDLCYERAKGNLQLLVEALQPLHPRLRGVPEEIPFQWDVQTLHQGMNFTLVTDAGPLDLIGEVLGLGGYDDVQKAAVEMDLFGTPTQVLSLDGLIRAKEATGRAKDVRLLPELRALQELYQGPSGEGLDPDGPA